MINIRFELQKQGLSGAQLNRTMKEVLKAAAFELGVHFFEVNFPRRFTYAGGKMLGYTPRKPKYNAAKKRRKGHVDPLVHSGRSRTLATGIQDVRVRATDSTTTVEINFGRARALNFKNPHSAVNMRDEVTRVADRETGPLIRVLSDSIERQIAKVQQNDR